MLQHKYCLLGFLQFTKGKRRAKNRRCSDFFKGYVLFFEESPPCNIFSFPPCPVYLQCQAYSTSLEGKTTLFAEENSNQSGMQCFLVIHTFVLFT